MRRRGVRLSLVALGIIWIAPVGAVEISGIIGFDGAVRAHRWNPVLISLAAGGTPVVGTLEIETTPGPLTDERESRYTVRVPLRLESGERRLIREVVPIGRTILPVRVRVVEEHTDAPTPGTRSDGTSTVRVVAEEHLSAALTLTDRPLILTLGVEAARTAGLSDFGVVVAPFVEQLPDHAAGYEPVSLIIVERPSIARTAAVQRRALSAWVDDGGTVVWLGDAAGVERDLGIHPHREPAGLVFVAPVEADGSTFTAILRHVETTAGAPPLPTFDSRVAFADAAHGALLPGIVYRYPSRMSVALPLAMVTAAFWWFASPSRKKRMGHSALVIVGATAALYLTFGVFARPPSTVDVEVQTLNAEASAARGVLRRELIFASVTPATRRVVASYDDVVVPTRGDTIVERNGDGTLAFSFETEPWHHRYAVVARRHRPPLQAHYGEATLVVTTDDDTPLSSFAVVGSTDVGLFGPLDSASRRRLSTDELAVGRSEETVDVRLEELRDELRRRGRRLSDGDLSVVALLRHPIAPPLLDTAHEHTIARVELDVGWTDR